MSAGSGMLLPTLDDLIDSAGRRSGVAAVLDAADKARRRLDDAEHRASFAPPPTHFAQCVCGSVMEILGDLDEEDCDAIRDWHYEHAACEVDA